MGAIIKKLRSCEMTEGLAFAGNRTLMYALGIDREEMERNSEAPGRCGRPAENCPAGRSPGKSTMKWKKASAEAWDPVQ